MKCECSDREHSPLKPALKNGKLKQSDLIIVSPPCR